MLLTRYLYRTLSKPLLSGIAGATFLILIDFLSEIIEKIVVNRVPFLQLLELLSYRVLNQLSFTVPMGMMIGSLIAYGNMSNENEIAALNSLGISVTKILRPMLILSFSIFACLIFINQFLSPVASQREEDALKVLAYSNPALGLSERQFITNIKGYSIYLDSFNGQTKQAGSFILFANENNNPFASIISGKGVKWDDGYMILQDAKAYEIEANGAKKAFMEFLEQKIPIRSKMMDFDFLGMKMEDNQMSLTELISTIYNRQLKKLSTKRYEMVLHTKLSLDFCAIVMGMLGSLLAVGVHKRFRKGDGKLTGIAVLFIYWVWLISSRGVIESNNFPAYILWGPNIFFSAIALAIYLYKRRS
jgi:lipopolysaccharide export system permease protein